jgi:hypothetical protein
MFLPLREAHSGRLGCSAGKAGGYGRCSCKSRWSGCCRSSHDQYPRPAGHWRERFPDLRVLRPLALAPTRGRISALSAQTCFETLPEKAKAAMPVALAAQLCWRELTCAPSFTWYGVLGGAAWRKGVRHGVFAASAHTATVQAPLEGPAPRQCSAEATEKAPKTRSTLIHADPR